MSKVMLPVWELPTSNGCFIRGTKWGTKVHPQFRTVLKGHPNARAPHNFVEVFIATVPPFYFSFCPNLLLSHLHTYGF